MAADGIVELTQLSPDFVRDPYPVYAALRAEAPVHHVRVPDGRELWLVVGHETCRTAFTDPRLSRDWQNHGGIGQILNPGLPAIGHMLTTDPPDHTRLRRLVSKAFTPARVSEFEPRVRELTDRLVDGFASRGEADLIHEFAFPLPIYAICDLLGVPAEDQDDFRDWAGMMIRHGGGPRGGVARSVKKMRGYLAELIHRKRASLGQTAEPDEDLISGLIRASDHG